MAPGGILDRSDTGWIVGELVFAAVALIGGVVISMFAIETKPGILEELVPCPPGCLIGLPGKACASF